MKLRSSHLLLTAAFTLLALPVLLGTPLASAKGAKVEVCHIPPGNPDNAHTITVSEKAVDAHLAHGDLEGACDAQVTCPCFDAARADEAWASCPDVPVVTSCQTPLDGARFMECDVDILLFSQCDNLDPRNCFCGDRAGVGAISVEENEACIAILDPFCD